MNDWLFWECPACEYTVVTTSAMIGRLFCRICAEDNGRDQSMRWRFCLPGDEPEGPDARKAPDARKLSQ